MKQTFVFFWFLVGSVFLSACVSQSRQPVLIASSTFTPFPLRPTVTLTPSPSLAPDLTITPFSEYPPYQTKQVLLDYNASGFHTPYDMNLDWTYSNLVLYSDGQIIIPGKIYKQKILSADEINQFFAQLEAMQFFSLTQDQVYEFGNQDPPRVYDGTMYCVLVTGKREQNLCAYEPHEAFLVPEMRHILQFLNKYQPEGMTPYFPDRVLLWVQLGRSPYLDDPSQKAIPWSEKLKSLDTPAEKIMYFQGHDAEEVFALFGNTVTSEVFSDKEKEYTVSIGIVLPHEQVIQP
jgi:hypothetical protein